MTIVEFITERLDEDEAAANSRTRMATGPAETCVVGGMELTAAWSIPASDPDRRALADTAAKRATIERYTEAQDAAGGIAETFADDDSTRAKVERAGYSQAAGALAAVVRDLASVYSDHPDYRQEWRP